MLMRATSKTLREPRPYPVRGNTGWTVDKGTSTGTGTGGRAGGSVDAVATREPDSAGRAATTDGVDAAAPIAGAAPAVRAGSGVATTEATGVLLPAVAAPGYAAAACPPGEGVVPLAAASAGTGPAASDGAASEGPDAVGAGVTPGAAPAAEARLLARPGAGTLAAKGGVMTAADARTGGGAAGRAGAGTVPEAASFAPTRTPVAVLRSGVGPEVGVGVGTSIGVGAGRAAGAGAGAGAGKLVEAFVDVAAAVVAGTAATRAAGACA
jgi:hypothetical protein